MARLIEQVEIETDEATVWAAIADIGGLDWMVPQLVESCTYDDSRRVREVTFRNGMTLVEPIVACDEETRTLVWTAQGGDWTHHNASVSVIAAGAGGCFVRWIADVLPDAEAETITQIMQAGLGAMKETLEAKNAD
ncbi:MAG: SRPBCC family protein [Pseudomonadota bacterium]